MESKVMQIRPLRQDELDRADRIMRLAFGTFVGMPEPESFMGDADYVRTRWIADPSAAFAAEMNGELAGSNFATNWGSVGFFGPLTVRPDLWGRGVAKRLMEPVLALFDRWQVKHAGLFTFAESEKHIALYQRFDFWPRFLTALMSKPVRQAPKSPGLSLFSQVPQGERESCLSACRALTDAVFGGLDLQREIDAVAHQNLGDTLLLWNGSSLEGLAVCHAGSRTEAGAGRYYVKFAAVRPDPDAAAAFGRLLVACEAHAFALGAQTVIAGVNLSRHEAYRALLARGFSTHMQGVAMQRGNEPGYNKPGSYVIDDWR
jgi:GNAT superfamily N-acetyltransferase